MKRLTYILLFALVLYLIYEYFTKKNKTKKILVVNNIYLNEVEPKKILNAIESSNKLMIDINKVIEDSPSFSEEI